MQKPGLKGLTPLQAQLLGYLRRYCEQQKRSPSYREMQLEMGLGSVSAVQARLRRLERHGLIERRPGARGIIPVSNPAQVRTTHLFEHDIKSLPEAQGVVLVQRE